MEMKCPIQEVKERLAEFPNFCGIVGFTSTHGAIGATAKICVHNGKIHKRGSPAVYWDNGGTEWFLDGLLHREDGPAIIVYGILIWGINGKKFYNEKKWEIALREYKLEKFLEYAL